MAAPATATPTPTQTQTQRCVAGRRALRCGGVAGRRAPRRRLMLLLLACVLLISSAPRRAEATVTYSRLFRDDRPLIPIAPAFGFGPSGRIEVRLADVGVWTPHDDARDKADMARLGVVLLSPEMGEQIYAMAASAASAASAAPSSSGGRAKAAQQQQQQQQQCLLDAPADGVLFRFNHEAVARVVAGKGPNATFVVDVEDGGYVQPFFVNCDRPGTAVSMRAVVAAYNLRGGDGRRSYLGVGELGLVALYWAMFALFAAFFVGWCAILVARRASTHKVHFVMAALALCKALTMLAHAVMLRHIEATGGGGAAGALFHFLTAARGLLLFAVIALLGAGWTLMNVHLDDRSRTVLLVIVPLQVAANVALLVVDDESPALQGYLSWRQVLVMLDLACCVLVLLPIVWQAQHLKQAAAADGKAAQSLARLRLFRSFYVAVVVFIYTTRLVVDAIKDAVDWRFLWAADAVGEAATIVFYAFMFFAFRPCPRGGTYAALTDEDIELATRY